MSEWTHRCLIVPAALQAQCRALAAQVLGEQQAEGMWITGLSPTGASPATHFVSVGLMWQSFADLLSSPEALSAGAGIPLANAQAILGACDVSEDQAFDALARLNLKLVNDDVA